MCAASSALPREPVLGEAVRLVVAAMDILEHMLFVEALVEIAHNALHGK